MSATDEELENVHNRGMDHVTYVIIMYRSVWVLKHHAMTNTKNTF